MRKLITILCVLLILTSSAFALELTYDGTTREYTGPDVSLYVKNEKFIPKEGQMPCIIIDGRTLVPVREVFELLGGNVTWEAETKKVGVKIYNNNVELTINNTTAIVNNEEKELDVPAKIINNKTMVPVRFISENCGLKVDWDAETKSVFITNPSEEIQEATQVPVAPEETKEIVPTQTVTEQPKEPEPVQETPTVTEGKPVKLLDVEGMRLNLATIMLGYDNLKVKTVYESSNDVPVETVIRQSPVANSTVFEGTTITLYVSSGKATKEEPVRQSEPVTPQIVETKPIVELEKTYEDIPAPTDIPLAIKSYNEKYSKFFGEDKGKNATYQLIDLIITNNLNADNSITVVYQDGQGNQKISAEVAGIYDIKADVMSIFTGRFSIYGRYDETGYINKIIITKIG